MVHSVKVAQKPRRAGGGPAEKIKPVARRHPEGDAPAPQQDRREQQSQQVAEQRLLHAGQITRKVDHGGHPGEKDSGQQRAAQSGIFGRDPSEQT